MKKLVFLTSAILAFAACKKETACGEIEPCLEAKFEEFKASTNAISIRKQEVNGENHYWFNDGSTAWDGVEYILNETCDTVCYFCGECQLPACLEDYTGSWEVVWEK
ncbi:MAG: hypothetical protein HY842_20455 [Bacteroidetes bacterium]|nr:hypothetical protein [Bacteroidota bacterium]